MSLMLPSSHSNPHFPLDWLLAYAHLSDCAGYLLHCQLEIHVDHPMDDPLSTTRYISCQALEH